MSEIIRYLSFFDKLISFSIISFRFIHVVTNGKKKKNTLIDTDNNSMMITGREVGWEEVEEGKAGISGDGRRLDLGW